MEAFLQPVIIAQYCNPLRHVDIDLRYREFIQSLPKDIMNILLTHMVYCNCKYRYLIFFLKLVHDSLAGRRMHIRTVDNDNKRLANRLEFINDLCLSFDIGFS